MVDLYSSIPVLQKENLKEYLYSNINFLNSLIANIPFLRKRILKSRPVTIMIETTNICTNNCIICPNMTGSEKKNIMSIELFSKILSDYSEMGGGYISLTPQRGDVLTDKYLKDRIELVQQFPKIKGISVTTNAINCNAFSDDELEYILNKLDRIHISIYGLDEEEYSLITRRKTYRIMIENINKIIKLSKKENIVFGFRLLKKRSISEINNWIIKNFNRLFPFGYTTSYHNWGGKLDTTICLPFDGTWSEKPEKYTYPCFLLLLSLRIRNNGQVFLCVCANFNKDEEFYLGDLNEEKLSTIFNSSKTANLWDYSKNIPMTCKNCSYYQSIDKFNVIDICQNPLNYLGG